MSYGYRIGMPNQELECKQELRALLEKYKSKEYKETPLLDNFDKICKIIGKANYEGDTEKAALLLIYDVCIRKELHQLENTI